MSSSKLSSAATSTTAGEVEDDAELAVEDLDECWPFLAVFLGRAPSALSKSPFSSASFSFSPARRLLASNLPR
jgi:hypothetical protein